MNLTDLLALRPWWASYAVVASGIVYGWCVVNLVVDYRKDRRGISDGKP
jgi:hypothetical protein